MNTSSVTYHRIVFNDVTDYPSLHELSLVLDLQATDHPDIFDLVQDEGCSISSTSAIELVGDAYGLSGSMDPVDRSTVLKSLRGKAEQIGYTPRTRIFEDSYHSSGVDLDIEPKELMDLLVVVGGPYFTVENITTQWAVFSNKNQAGAHSGGSRITTRHFSIPVVLHCDEMETIVNRMACQVPANSGDDYVDTFIIPLMNENAITNPELRKSVARALLLRAAQELPQSEVADLLL